MIPISAIVLGIGSGIVHRILESQERRLKMRLDQQQGQNDAVMQQLQTLQAEVTGLRDTSTQFDLSLDDAFRRLADRVARVETKSSAHIGSAPVEESTQQAGLR